MVVANRTRLNEAMDVLKDGLIPYVEAQLEAHLGDDWIDRFQNENRYVKLNSDGSVHWDVQLLCKTISGGYWNTIFQSKLDRIVRTYTNELLDVRNKIAHEEQFSGDQTYRALDTMQLLCEQIGATANANLLGSRKQDHQRQVYELQTRDRSRTKAVQGTLEGVSTGGLLPWREIVTPHTDVASGNYMQAEFAADLAQVHKGEGQSEYLDPVEFFQRTYLTDGIKELIKGAVQRIANTGGDPVVELQTNFGGGKTHSLLALYHLFSGTAPAQLQGVMELLQESSLPEPGRAARAVLVGTALSPGQVEVKADGTHVRTLWGELAWQLGGAEGYEFVRESDENRVSPGSDVLQKLFNHCGKCLILIDEWVAYARQLVDRDDLVSGNFEAQKTFAQALTEAAAQSPETLLVASVPASKIELGGENGERALEMLKNVFERVAVPWRPATGDEGFEIVRRRLFETIESRESFTQRDAVLHQFVKMYRDHPEKFPVECNDGEYFEKLKQCYPIHPELFRRLYDDWSALDRFQRTRGVLRLMAKVIHRLWESGNSSLLIMPGSVPLDDGPVRSEMTRYLPDVWEPIISKDVDGEDSLPKQIDEQVPNLGRFLATRRVTRTLFIGSAPYSDTDTPGIGSERIALGCAQPGETLGIFDDGLRRVVEQATNIHSGGNRYWVSTKNNLNRTAEGKVAHYLRNREELFAEIQSRLMREPRSHFPGVHTCVVDNSEIPDEPKVRLVILKPQLSHKRNNQNSSAMEFAKAAVDKRGNSPRVHKNCLVFIGADDRELESLLEKCAQFLAWREILSQNVSLNLDAHQKQTAEDRTEELTRAIDGMIQQVWTQLLVPRQESPGAEVSWEDSKAGGSDGVAERAWTKLQRSESVFPAMGGARLKMELDRHDWFERDDLSFGDLADWFSKYLYLPRLTSSSVLENSIRDGLSAVVDDEKQFAVADRVYSEKTGVDRYENLTLSNAPGNVTNSTAIVKKEIAQEILRSIVPDADFEVGQKVSRVSDNTVGVILGANRTTSGDFIYDVDFEGESTSSVVREEDLQPYTNEPGESVPEEVSLKRRFAGSIELTTDRIASKVGQINDEVLMHLSLLPNSRVTINLDVQIECPEGIPQDTERTVKENARALGFGTVHLEE